MENVVNSNVDFMPPSSIEINYLECWHRIESPRLSLANILRRSIWLPTTWCLYISFLPELRKDDWLFSSLLCY